MELVEIRKGRMLYLKHVLILAAMRWFVWCETEVAQSRKSKCQKIDYIRENVEMLGSVVYLYNIRAGVKLPTVMMNWLFHCIYVGNIPGDFIKLFLSPAQTRIHLS